MAPRSRQAPLSRDRVLAAAVDLADAEGVAALTMRRLAADLGVEAMALYHHLANKEAVLDGVVERVVEEIRAAVADLGPAGPEQDWRATLRGWFLAARAVMLRHPWAPGLFVSRARVPAALYPYYDQILGTLVGGGFSYRIAHRALHAFGSMTLGFTQEVFTAPAAGAGADRQTADDAPDPMADSMAEMAAALPHLTAMVEHEFHAAEDPTLGWCDSQVEFEFTLDLILDGLDRFRSH